MNDDDLPPPEELEQLARSLAMDGSLGRHDALTVAAVLRWVAARRRLSTERRHAVKVASTPSPGPLVSEESTRTVPSRRFIERSGHMKTRRVLGAIASIGIVIGGAVAAPAAASAKAEKVDVCHDGDYGWELINVSVNALDAHLRHGDGVPGGEVPGHSGNYFADDCLSTYGDVVVTLEWYGINDQDLHVIEPSGEHIYWSHPTSANGGQLDQDDNPDCVDETPREHQETVTWPAGASPLGDYDTYVDVWSQCGTAIETWTLTVEVGGVTVVQETGNTDPSATYSFANPS